MTARVIAVDPFDIVVFGATGDLARRKLLPALFYRFAGGQAPAEMRIFGVARSKLNDEQFRAEAQEAILAHVAPTDRDPDLVAAFLNRLHYVSADAMNDSENGWDGLKGALNAHNDRIRIFYLATAPELFGPICDRLARHDMVNE